MVVTGWGMRQPLLMKYCTYNLMSEEQSKVSFEPGKKLWPVLTMPYAVSALLQRIDLLEQIPLRSELAPSYVQTWWRILAFHL